MYDILYYNRLVCYRILPDITGHNIPDMLNIPEVEFQNLCVLLLFKYMCMLI